MRFVSFDGPDARDEEDLQKVCLYAIGPNRFFHSPQNLCTFVRKIIQYTHIYSTFS